ncbi:hypothetical protein DFH28DRAFT_886238 [Melampsora americana]|nr:hypothetical protein DFH28DRAFT_886238 [Melampsora americana]
MTTLDHSQQQEQPTLEPTTSTSELTPLLNHKHQSTQYKLCSIQPHQLSTSLILHLNRQSDFLTSVSLNEFDVSVEPFGSDIGSENSFSFRRTRLILLDVIRGFILCLQVIDTATEYLGPSSSKYSQSWHQHIFFPLPHSTFILHMITLVCTPALHFLLGCGAVLAIETRRSLGWSSIRLIRRSVKFGLVLLILNQILMSQRIIQSRGNVLLIMLPIWSLGFNLVIITSCLIGIHQIQKAFLKSLLKKFQVTSPSTDDRPPDLDLISSQLGAWPSYINLCIDILMILIGLSLPLLIGYMLPGSPDAPDQDWWIDWAQTRSWWFWFLVTPSPHMSSHPRSYLISSYAPIGWFPYVILGAVYGRDLIRKRRTKASYFTYHLSLAFYAAIIFILTRLLDIGNHSIPHYNQQPDSPLLPNRRLKWLRGNWQMLIYTTQFPPDLAHLSLSLSIQFIMFGFFDLVPSKLLENNPFLQFGRSSMIFYSIQLLSFHYILPPLLSILDWSNQLNVFWCSVIGLSCLPVFWLICETWMIFKDQQTPQSVKLISL